MTYHQSQSAFVSQCSIVIFGVKPVHLSNFSEWGILQSNMLQRRRGKDKYQNGLRII